MKIYATYSFTIIFIWHFFLPAEWACPECFHAMLHEVPKHWNIRIANHWSETLRAVKRAEKNRSLSFAYTIREFGCKKKATKRRSRSRNLFGVISVHNTFKSGFCCCFVDVNWLRGKKKRKSNSKCENYLISLRQKLHKEKKTDGLSCREWRHNKLFTEELECVISDQFSEIEWKSWTSRRNWKRRSFFNSFAQSQLIIILLKVLAW